ncbi:MAG: GFA family protein [Rhodospirillaceae bacterium]|nr:GFA family protein [Rhodospirillaceae bacterium]
MTAPYSGGCGCGAIRYTVTSEPLISYLCHCTECQRRTSSAFGLNFQIPTKNLVIDKGTPASRTRTADSGNDLALNFCGDCGTPLFSAPGARPQIRVIYAGTLDDPSWVPVKLNIWTASALPWVPMDTGIANEPGQPNMADYIGKV